jgi:hypothetical protein
VKRFGSDVVSTYKGVSRALTTAKTVGRTERMMRNTTKEINTLADTAKSYIGPVVKTGGQVVNAIGSMMSDPGCPGSQRIYSLASRYAPSVRAIPKIGSWWTSIPHPSTRPTQSPTLAERQLQRRPAHSTKPTSSMGDTVSKYASSAVNTASSIARWIQSGIETAGSVVDGLVSGNTECGGIHGIGTA